MTTAKLRQCGDSIKVIFSKSISKKNDVGGERSISSIVVATVDINSDFGRIDILSENEVVDFRLWADKQLRLIRNAFAKNASRGIYGGRPVIRDSKSTFALYGSHMDYITGCRYGEFTGIVSGTYQTGHALEFPKNTGEIYAWLDRCKDAGRLEEILDPVIDWVNQKMESSYKKNGVSAYSESEEIELYMSLRRWYGCLKITFDLPGGKITNSERERDAIWSESYQQRVDEYMCGKYEKTT